MFFRFIFPRFYLLLIARAGEKETIKICKSIDFHNHTYRIKVVWGKTLNGKEITHTFYCSCAVNYPRKELMLKIWMLKGIYGKKSNFWSVKHFYMKSSILNNLKPPRNMKRLKTHNKVFLLSVQKFTTWWALIWLETFIRVLQDFIIHFLNNFILRSEHFVQFIHWAKNQFKKKCSFFCVFLAWKSKRRH